MNILIYGKGWIEDFESYPMDFKQCFNTRVNTIEDVMNDLNNPETTHVISFIGRTHGKIDRKTYSTLIT